MRLFRLRHTRFHCAGNDALKARNIAGLEAFDRYGDPFLGIDLLQCDLMAGLFAKGLEEGAVRTAVPLPERMNGVEFGEMFGGARCEVLWREFLKKLFRRQLCKTAVHLVLDISRAAKQVVRFRNIDRAVFTSPGIDILKDMVMQLAIALRGHWDTRAALRNPLRRRFNLKRAQNILVADVQFVDENICAWIAVRVGHYSAAATLAPAFA